ncbi:hypothetical protein GCM10007301_16080 [Azorhizobium oxalatiphilum]|uniref:Uncharacterized protein n=1 Tax=Azorhizobium oxalatiphilum TaxID=980631 RepID=A0A917F864_9HYPH|nr:DUF4286 family protein [Azorhizobium oxalatiphilum]GGF57158.1 hypothetical protein GCM10007301_16080 [Azorhizobium oxalatiphilum]
MTGNKGLLLVSMEPPANLEEEFNDWYDTEHFPQRRALPGFESAARWVCLVGWPRWLALYDLASTAALETDAYRAVSAGNSTPWSKRILPRTMGRQRVVAEQVHPGGVLARPSGEAVSLLAACYRPALHQPAFLSALEETCRPLPHLLQARLFQQTEATGTSIWLLAEFAAPQTIEPLRSALASVTGTGAMMFNLYAPYFRG